MEIKPNVSSEILGIPHYITEEIESCDFEPPDGATLER